MCNAAVFHRVKKRKREVRERDLDVTTHQTHIYTYRTEVPTHYQGHKEMGAEANTNTHTLSVSRPHIKPPLLGGLRHGKIFGTVLVAVSVRDKVKYLIAENTKCSLSLFYISPTFTEWDANVYNMQYDQCTPFQFMHFDLYVLYNI